jgi:hypothetical protein
MAKEVEGFGLREMVGVTNLRSLRAHAGSKDPIRPLVRGKEDLRRHFLKVGDLSEVLGRLQHGQPTLTWFG